MARTYPRIGTVEKLRHRKCKFCDHAATYRVDVQTTWTRGDDEVFHLCHEHFALYSKNPRTLLAEGRAAS